MTIETAGAVAVVVAAISGMIVAIYKLRPESTRIFVDSAKVSVELADADRSDCLKTLERERAENAQYRADTSAHMAEQATTIRAQRAEIRHLRELLGHEETP